MGKERPRARQPAAIYGKVRRAPVSKKPIGRGDHLPGRGGPVPGNPLRRNREK